MTKHWAKVVSAGVECASSASARPSLNHVDGWYEGPRAHRVHRGRGKPALQRSPRCRALTMGSCAVRTRSRASCSPGLATSTPRARRTSRSSHRVRARSLDSPGAGSRGERVRQADQRCAAAETPASTIEAAFAEYTERSDMAVVLINQHVRLALHRLSARTPMSPLTLLTPFHPALLT